MTTLKKAQHPYLQTASLIAGGTTLLLAALAVKYPDRPPFTEARPELYSVDTWPLLGMIPAVIKHRQSLHDYIVSLTDRVDKMTGTAIGLGLPRFIATIDPQNIDHILRANFENYIKGPLFNDAAGDLLGHGIFNADGEVWRYQRKAASHIFNVKNFRDNFTKVFLRNLQSMDTDIFATAAQDPIDLHDIMHKFTLDSFLEISFGITSMSNETKTTFVNSFDACQRNVIQRVANPAYRVTECLEGWLPWKKTTTKQHLANVNDFAQKVIAQRRLDDEADTRGDLLSRFMTTKNDKGQLLSDTELRDIILNFVIAGRDTTAQAITWTFYMLVTHPSVTGKLLDEINALVTDEIENDPVAIYQAVQRMKYANAVFKEVLRLYPPVPFNGKSTLQDDVWPDGTRVKKGDQIFLSLWTQGRSSKIWGHDAREFKPERWFTHDGGLKQEHPSKWNIFNAGPRTCLGQVLGSTVALISICYLLRRYDFTLVPGQDITYQVAMTLPMKNGLKVRVSPKDQH